MVGDSDAGSCHNGRLVVRTNEGPGRAYHPTEAFNLWTSDCGA